MNLYKDSCLIAINFSILISFAKLIQLIDYTHYNLNTFQNINIQSMRKLQKCTFWIVLSYTLSSFSYTLVITLYLLSGLGIFVVLNLLRFIGLNLQLITEGA